MARRFNLGFLALLLLPSLASAQYRVLGDAAELGGWEYGAGAALADDGVAPDEAAADGIFTAGVTFAAAGEVLYKVSDGTNWYGGAGGQNMRFDATAGAGVVFYLDTRDRSAEGWLPASLSVSDSVNAAQVFVAVGDHLGWTPDSTTTVAADAGAQGDALASDGIHAYRFVAAADVTSPYKFVRQGPWAGSIKLGTDGWGFDPGDAANGTFTAVAGDIVTLEADARYGRVRARVQQPAKLLLTEVVHTPTQAEYVEIYNPGSAAVALDDYYVADRYTYYEVVNGTGGGASDFILRFPAGAVIPAGAYQTVALQGADCFATACGSTGAWQGYGVDPTYESPTLSQSATVPDMREAYPGSVAVGSSTYASLTNGGEPVVLFFWDGVSDLVQDVDYVVFGNPSTANPGVNKTGVTVDGPDADVDASAYLADTADDPARHFLVPTGTVACRKAFTEPGQTNPGNGVEGEDETSEDFSQTWRACAAITPNGPSAQSIVPDPVSAPIVLGATHTFTAAVYGDAEQAQTITRPITWSAGTALAFAGDVGTASELGTHTVTATADGLAATVDVSVVLASIVITCPPALGLGATSTCTAEGRDATGQPVQTEFLWTVVSGTSVTIDPVTGVVTADASITGQTTVQAHSALDLETTATAVIDVQSPIVSNLAIALASTCPSAECLVVMEGTDYTVAALGSLTFAATGVDQFGNPMTVTGATWTSADVTIAPDPVAGVLTALDVDGVATIVNAVLDGAVSNDIVVWVEQRRPANATITGVPVNGNLAQGGTATLAVDVTDQFGAAMAGQSVSWSTSDAACVSVAAGVLTAGTDLCQATLTATVAGAPAAEVVISVVAATPVLTTILLDPSDSGLIVGDTVQLFPSALDQFGAAMSGVSFTWTSSDEAVATVDANGLATAVGAGSATISAASGGVQGTALLTVDLPPPVLTSITLTPTEATLAVGETVTFTAVAHDQYGEVFDGAEFVWTSSDEAVATVDASGTVTGEGAGSAILTVSAEGAEATAAVVVTAAPVVAIEITPDPVSLTVGSTQQVTAVAYDAEGNEVEVIFTWESGDTAVVTVDASAAGVTLTGVGHGAAVVTATADGVSGTVDVSVVAEQPVVASVVVSPATAQIRTGDGISLTATAFAADGTAIGGQSFTWSSSDETVATVQDGVVTGVAAGSATIEAAVDGIRGAAAVTVTSRLDPPVEEPGCGCAASGSSGQAAWLGLGLVGLLAFRRRRR